MAKKLKIVCLNCGREISGINAAKNDGWLLQEDGKTFCCCVCLGEYNRRSITKPSGRKKK